MNPSVFVRKQHLDDDYIGLNGVTPGYVCDGSGPSSCFVLLHAVNLRVNIIK